ncbi:unnamed protein product [[Candida] boidinii]|nr:hypothetical protein B5S30_g3558 [[Candida] boidinii]OWB86569.1 hypothetical protein B5S33_g5271 [[Candida] boidinii]GME92319.1 unnamed protein product [[Candida] boidinii]GMG09443.1 unnamed protein product [[Candida] boidinii]
MSTETKEPVVDSSAADETPEVIAATETDEIKIEPKEESKEESKEEPVSESKTEPTLPSDATPDSYIAPPMPSRPLSKTEKTIQQLKEAFPSIEEKYIRMSLIASQGLLDPAFNALLYLSDPASFPSDPTEVIPTVVSQDIEDDETPKLPTRSESVLKQRQMESDEALARRLAREYERRASTHSHSSHRHSQRNPQQPPPPPPQQGQTRSNKTPDWYKDVDKDDESEDIIDSMAKGLEETRQKVNGWIGSFTKKINENPDYQKIFGETNNKDNNNANNNRNKSKNSNNSKNSQLFSALGNNNNNNNNNIDNDNNLNDYSSDLQQPIRMTNNEDRNSDLKSQRSKSSGTDNLLNDEDIYGTPKKQSSNNIDSASYENKRMPPLPTRPSAGKPTIEKSATEATANKWEPLSVVAPEPIADDTFLVDDSEDEEDLDETAAAAKTDATATKEDKKEDVKTEDK